MVRAMCGQKVVDCRTDWHVGFEGNYRPVGISDGRWYGYVIKRNDNSVLRIALDLAPDLEWQEKVRTTEEDLEEASGEDREDWFEKGGCPELSKVERRSVSNCRGNGVSQPPLLMGEHRI